MTEQIHIDYIRKAFHEMTTIEDFLVLLNYAKPLVYGEDHYAFEMKQITYYVKNRSTLNTPESQNETSGAKLTLRENVPPLVFINEPNRIYGKKRNAVPDTRYISFQIKKKSGSTRNIHAPVPGLKAIQTTLGFILQCIFQPHKAAMGFVRGKSIVDNAKIHTEQNYVYNVDLKDFFPSIDQARVWKCLQLKPFNLTDGAVDETKAFEKTKGRDLKFVTDHGDTVHYRIIIGQCKLIPDNFGYLRYLSRFIKQFPIPDFTHITDEAELNELKSNYRKQVKSAMLQDAQKYILTEEHKKYLQRSLPLRRNIANTIASLCCTEMMVERKAENGEWESVRRNVLPQGAPTSPVITNIICQRLDYLLTAVAKRFGLRYSRYADDITFSSMHNVYQPEGDFLKELQRIILEQGFHIRETKTRLQKDGYRKEVTGLLVNEKANVQKRYIKQLRMWLYYWENYGYDRAYSFFLQQYMADKANIVKGKPSMVNVIGGKLDYLKMVKGKENELYLKLKGRLNALTATNIKPKPILEEAFTAEANINQVKITLEAYQSLEMNEKLNNSINIPKDTVLPSTIIVPNSIEQKEDAKSKLNNLYPIVHTPIKTVELLKYFTANDKDLKYSTHSWEEGKYRSYEEYIEKIKIEWKKIKDELYVQSDRLYTKILYFLFKDNLGQKNEKGYYNVWGEKRLKFGWSSPELKNHMSEAGNSPFSCPIPNHIRELDKKYDLIYFKDYCDVFKNEIEFREDSNNFKKMILDLWESDLSYDFEIKGIKDLVGFSFFTDVNYVKDSMKILFGDLFKTKPEFPEIIIEKHSNFENGAYHLIRILQKDSFVTREIKDPKFENPTGNLHSIIKNLKNLADYSIVSRFADGKNYRINYLTSTETKFIVDVPANEKVLGFTHEFKFYL